MGAVSTRDLGTKLVECIGEKHIQQCFMIHFITEKPINEQCFGSNRKKDAYSHSRLNAGKRDSFRRLTMHLEKGTYSNLHLSGNILRPQRSALKFAAPTGAVP